MWNKKGSVLLYGVMLSLTIIILTLALAPAVSEFTVTARNASVVNATVGMDCGNSSISDFTKAACYATDLNLFYFIGGLLFIGGAIFTAKIIFS